MWSLDSYWFEVAVIMSIFAVGNILFGHFEQHRPKWRRIAKVILFLAIFMSITTMFGRTWFIAVLLAVLGMALVIHVWWLPKNGVNGWTGEPRDRYLELMGHGHRSDK